jgi:dTDP-4-dehydrorhamnose reductase
VSRWAVIGAGGQLGSEVASLLVASGEEVAAPARAALDITSESQVRSFFEAGQPRVVVNCAAYNRVDDAEVHVERAFAVNAEGPRLLARAASQFGATLIHVSSDYVFAGDATEPYDEDSPRAPQTVYGRSKAMGEDAVLDNCDTAHVVRTAWLYGHTGDNFVRTIARLGGGPQPVAVVDDQVGNPTWARPLAGAIIALAESTQPSGCWHCVCSGAVSWFGFARAIFEEAGLPLERLQPTTTAMLPRAARRPAFSVLSTSKWERSGLPPMPHWRAALHQAFVAGV